MPAARIIALIERGRYLLTLLDTSPLACCMNAYSRRGRDAIAALIRALI